MNDRKYFKAFIRVVKDLRENENLHYFGSKNIITEKLIEAESKQQVKEYLLKKYPQFFQKEKIYEKSTKDDAQFFYVVIFPLYNYEIEYVKQGEWECSYCKQQYSNKYEFPPKDIQELPGQFFCRESDCVDNYYQDLMKEVTPDNIRFISASSPIYIYCIREKVTGKCYIGKTKNHPFFRWWDHLKNSFSPFGIYLQNTSIIDWTFEVLCVLDKDTSESEVFRIETEYMFSFNSIANGFNTVVSKK